MAPRNRMFAIYLLGSENTQISQFEKVILKPTNSPTQSQPNPIKKLSVKSSIWITFFQQQNIFSWVGWDWFSIGNQDCKKPNPIKVLRKHPINSKSSQLGTTVWIQY